MVKLLRVHEGLLLCNGWCNGSLELQGQLLSRGVCVDSSDLRFLSVGDELDVLPHPGRSHQARCILRRLVCILSIEYLWLERIMQLEQRIIALLLQQHLVLSLLGVELHSLILTHNH